MKGDNGVSHAAKSMTGPEKPTGYGCLGHLSNSPWSAAKAAKGSHHTCSNANAGSIQHRTGKRAVAHGQAVTYTASVYAVHGGQHKHNNRNLD